MATIRTVAWVSKGILGIFCYLLLTYLLPEEPTGPQLVRKFAAFYETRSPLLHSQQAASCSCPEPDRSSPCPHPASRRSILILSSHLRLGLSSCLLPSGFSLKIPHEPLLLAICATYPAHLSLLDWITRIIFCEEYRAWSSSLCSLLNSLHVRNMWCLNFAGPNKRNILSHEMWNLEIR